VIGVHPRAKWLPFAVDDQAISPIAVRFQRPELRELEERDREGYARLPQTPEELSWCEADPVWPEEETGQSIQQTGVHR
jgi:hypothetical protein